MDDIIFGSSDKMSKEFAEEITKEFEMLMIREINFSIGL